MAPSKRPPSRSITRLPDSSHDKWAPLSPRDSSFLRGGIPDETHAPTNWATRDHKRKKAEKEARRLQLEIASEIIQKKLDGDEVDPEQYEAALKVGRAEEAIARKEEEQRSATQPGAKEDPEDEARVQTVITNEPDSSKPRSAPYKSSAASFKMGKMLEKFGGLEIPDSEDEDDVSDEDMFGAMRLSESLWRNNPLGAVKGRQKNAAAPPLTASSLSLKDAREKVIHNAAPASDISSELTDITDVSGLNPDGTPKKKAAMPTKPRHQDSTRGQAAAATRASKAPRTYDERQQAWMEKHYDPEKAFPDQARAYLANALKTLEYEDKPKDLPAWISGLKKPLPHEKLTTAQNHEVLTRFYTSEIDRLVTLRLQLVTPLACSSSPSTPLSSSAGIGSGEWHYAHFGATVKISKRVRVDGKLKTAKVCARGVWKYVIEGKAEKRVFDEWPKDVWGEPLGWMVRRKERESEDEIDRGDDDDDEGVDQTVDNVRGKGAVRGGMDDEWVGEEGGDAAESEDDGVEVHAVKGAGRRGRLRNSKRRPMRMA